MMQLVPIRKKYVYERLERIDSPEGRTYTNGQLVLPSVTNILSATKDKGALAEWESRVGPEEAERVRSDAALVGTHMHNVVERLILNRPLEVPRTWAQVKGYRMGYTLIETFFPHVQEVWGTEIPLYHSTLYAGTADCLGLYREKSAIIDFKQTNKMKQRKWIEDYFLQLAAYALAHDDRHGTKIEQGVIMMVAQNGETQPFVTCGREFDNYKDQWMRRVAAFHKKEGGPKTA
jgi:genome maintenance exonuclease 1